MRTPIQQAIEEIKVFRNKASFEYKAATTNEDKEEWLSSISAIDSCLGVLKNHLPKEQKAIQEAHYKGQADGAFLAIAHKEYSEVYYISTYGQTNND